MFRKIFKNIRKLFLIIASVLVFVWVISPVRTLLIESGIIVEVEAIFGIISISLVLILLTLDKNNKAVSKLNDKVNHLIAKDHYIKIIEDGVKNVYPELLDVIKNNKKKKGNELNVIGLTLYSAWPQIHGWIMGKKTKNWIINLYLICPDFVKDNTDIFDESWSAISASNLSLIEKFIENKKDYLSKNKIKIKISTYKIIPFIHGFKVNEKVILISYCEWDNSKIGMPTNFYEHIDLTNKDKRTKYYGCLFENHLNNLIR